MSAPYPRTSGRGHPADDRAPGCRPAIYDITVIDFTYTAVLTNTGAEPGPIAGAGPGPEAIHIIIERLMDTAGGAQARASTRPKAAPAQHDPGPEADALQERHGAGL